MASKEEIIDDLSSGEVFLDDALQVFGGAGVVPGPFGVDNGNRPPGADTQAVGLGAVDLLVQPQLGKTSFEVVPGAKALLFGRATGDGLITAEKDMALNLVYLL